MNRDRFVNIGFIGGAHQISQMIIEALKNFEIPCNIICIEEPDPMDTMLEDEIVICKYDDDTPLTSAIKKLSRKLVDNINASTKDYDKIETQFSKLANRQKRIEDLRRYTQSRIKKELPEDEKPIPRLSKRERRIRDRQPVKNATANINLKGTRKSHKTSISIKNRTH